MYSDLRAKAAIEAGCSGVARGAELVASLHYELRMEGDLEDFVDSVTQKANDFDQEDSILGPQQDFDQGDSVLDQGLRKEGWLVKLCCIIDPVVVAIGMQDSRSAIGQGPVID